MHHLTGLNINYLITLDFHAFTQIVYHLRRRVHERRPSLLHPAAHGRVRHQSPAGLPEAQRRTGAVVRALSAHGQRHLPHRQAAALPRGAEEPPQDESVDLRRPEARQRPEEEHRGGQGRRWFGDDQRARVVPRCRLRPPGRPPLPQPDSDRRSPERRHRWRGRRAGGIAGSGLDHSAQLPPSGRARDVGGRRAVRRAQGDAQEDDEAAQAAERSDLRARPQCAARSPERRRTPRTG